MPTRLDAEQLIGGIRARRRGHLARGITLIESTRPDDRSLAAEVLQALLPHTGNAIRLGISGVPGVGKSTFIEALGIHLIEQGHRLAVLAIDPSSRRTGGSILGDKTRMHTLSMHDQAFVRPSPASGHLGGVNRVTRESMLLCEAAGFDVVIVETVGVGQSETSVADMTDCYLVLMLPGAGDELQGIKKGVLELADIIAVNKADGHLRHDARQARAVYSRALSILQPSGSWTPRAVTVSSVTGDGLEAVWQLVIAHRECLQAIGEFDARREKQQLHWLRASIEQVLLREFYTAEALKSIREETERAVQQGELAVPLGVDRLLTAWRRSFGGAPNEPGNRSAAELRHR